MSHKHFGKLSVAVALKVSKRQSCNIDNFLLLFHLEFLKKKFQNKFKYQFHNYLNKNKSYMKIIFLDHSRFKF